MSLATPALLSWLGVAMCAGCGGAGEPESAGESTGGGGGDAGSDGGDSGGSGAGGGDEAGDSELSWPDPEWSAQDVTTELDLALSQEVGLGPSLLSAWIQAREAGDSTCPGEGYEVLDNQIPVTGCVSESGATFNGVLHVSMEDSGTDAYLNVDGDFFAERSSGEVFRVGGWSDLLATGVGTDDLSWQGQQFGTFFDTAADSWLADGVSSGLYLEGGQSPELGRWIQLDGGHGSLQAGLSVNFEALVLAGLDGSGSCEGAASGALELRDPSGSWYRLDFGSDCSPCATLTWADGSEVGEVCPDVGAWGASLHELTAPERWVERFP